MRRKQDNLALFMQSIGESTDKEILKTLKYVLSSYFYTTCFRISKNTRDRKTLYLRQCVQVFLFRYTELTLVNIGYITGNRSHSTICHSVKVLQGEEEISKIIHTEYELLQNYHRLESLCEKALNKKNIKMEFKDRH